MLSSYTCFTIMQRGKTDASHKKSLRANQLGTASKNLGGQRGIGPDHCAVHHPALERETQRTGRKLTQREFVLGLIEEALEAAERQADSPEPDAPPQEEAGAGPCEANPEGSGAQPQAEDNPAALGA